MKDDKRSPPAAPEKQKPEKTAPPETGLDPQRSGRTPETEPEKDKRIDNH